MRKKMVMKRSLFLAVSTLTFIIIIITGCWGHRSGRPISPFRKIEEFRKVKGPLPSSLSEAGAQDDETCPCYCKTGDDSYLVWYGTSLGESDTYDSETKNWSAGNRACPSEFAQTLNALPARSVQRRAGRNDTVPALNVSKNLR